MKVRIVSILAMTLFTLLMFGCAGTINVLVKPDTSFTPKSTITVVSSGYDPLGVQGKIEHLLLSRGFEVVSEAVASDKVRYQDKIKSDALGQSEAEAYLERVQEVRSTYILRFRYSYRADIPHGNVFRNFTASVVNLNTGKVVVSADFSQGDFGSKSVSSVLEEFVNKLTGSVTFER